jgi:HAD superfamily hydrolase (TIGR01484 family)
MLENSGIVMRYFALSCDYDGTLALNGQVGEEVTEALKRVRESGRKLILVTGRELDHLQEIYSHLELFDWVVAENGALLYQPVAREERMLGERPPAEFIRKLSERGVEPLSVGRVIVATWHPHENTVLQTIRDFGLELQVIFNKGAVMVLPSGMNKATGLKAALLEMGLSPHNTVGIGDAENDHAFLSLCHCAVAVSNALPTVKQRADLVTERDHGAGVIELIDLLLASDLSQLDAGNSRYDIPIGVTEEGQEVRLGSRGENVLVAGTSQAGKTTLTTGIIERLIDQQYQVCVIDPEGDYSQLEEAVVLGGDKSPPSVEEVMNLLDKPDENVVVNLLRIELEERPQFFTSMLSRLYESRAKTGRPHWIIIDEAHHFFPTMFEQTELALPLETSGLFLITVKPASVSRALLSVVDTIIAVGEFPDRTIQAFCQAIGESAPSLTTATLEQGEAVVWSRREESMPIRIRSIPPRAERTRHRRKYMEGELPEDRSFYFAGPEGKLRLRAQNLLLFLQLAEGVDDETWLFHLRRGDYSRWFREEINDNELAEEASRIERTATDSAQTSRAAIRSAVEERYTGSA